ncbi:hypothetical protein DSECCO2_597250 [anaerobic digester metagenome]
MLLAQPRGDQALAVDEGAAGHGQHRGPEGRARPFEAAGVGRVQHGPPEHPVPLGADLAHEALDVRLGHQVRRQDADEHLDGGFVLLGHNLLCAELHEGFDLGHEAGAHDNVQGRVVGPGRGHDAADGRRVRDDHGQDARLGHVDVFEHRRLGRVAVEDGLALGPLPAHGVGVHFQDDVADAGRLGRPRQVPAAQAETGDDEVVVHFGLGFPGRRGLEAGGHELDQTIGDGRDGGDEEGRHGHGHDGHGQEVLVFRRGEQLAAHAHAGQDEGELADLAQAQAPQDGHVPRVAQEPAGHGGQGGLEDQDGRGQPQDLRQVRDDEGRVQEHADGHEEDAGEHVAEGKHPFQGRMAVLGFAHDEPGQEGAQGQGQPDARRQQGDGEAQAQGGHEKEFAAARADDGLQYPRDELPGRHQQDAAHQGRLEAHLAQGHPRVAPRTGQQGHEEHHGHHGNVLEDEHAQGDAAVGRAQLGLLGQELQHDGRARQGGQEADEHGLAQPHPEGHEGQLEDGDGQQDLGRAADEDRLPEPLQFLQGQLHADDEQQQDDPDLSEDLDLVLRAHKAQPERPGQDARQQKADDRGNLEAVAGDDDGAGQAEDHDHIGQNGYFDAHVPLTEACGGRTRRR